MEGKNDDIFSELDKSAEEIRINLSPEVIKKTLDLDGDGKIGWSEIKEFLKSLLSTLVSIYIFLFIVYGERIAEMFVTKTWDSGFLYTNLVLGAGALLYAYLKKKFSRKISSDEKEIKELKSAAELKSKQIDELQKQITSILHKHELEITELKTQHKIEINELQLDIQKKVFQDIERDFMLKIKNNIAQNNL
jgi:peptidoglycan hydrolase CwlO-like protein